MAWQRMSARERVLLAIVVCLVLLVTPLTTLAAVGSLVTIADATNEARLARVSAAGALRTETRPGVDADTINVNSTIIAVGAKSQLAVAADGQRIAVTELTFAATGSAGAQRVELYSAIVADGNSCTGPVSGYINLRRVIVPNNTTLTLNFPGPPLFSYTSNAAQKVCLVADLEAAPSGSRLYVGGTGYRSTP